MLLDSHMPLLFIAAWFIQMGVHEGAHAYVANWCGDDTAALQGKRSFNPFAHVNWQDLGSVLMTVVVPVFTALKGLVPMGMASVPVNERRLKGWRRDMALVSFAGPAANLLVAALCLIPHLALGAVGYEPHSLLRILDDLLWAVYLTSLLYGIFNLLPIPPLDGSKVLHYFLPPGGRAVMDNLAPYGLLLLMAVFVAEFRLGLMSWPLGGAVQLWMSLPKIVPS